MIHIAVEQNTDAWFAEKLGKPSASRATDIMTMDLKPSKQRDAYLNELAAERITGQRDLLGYKNAYMQQGNEREDESRKLYELMYDCVVARAGICYPDEKKQYLCSPDGLIHGSHGWEVKNPSPKIQVKYLRQNNLPNEYFPQVQFSLLISSFKFWDFMSYSPGLKPLVIRVRRDEKYIAALRLELIKFCLELDEVVQRIT